MEYVTVARCAKNTGNWFVGGTNGEIPRVATVDFSFLPEGRKYIATIYRDGKDAHYRNNPTDYVIETKSVTSKTKLKINTAAGGGFAISLVPGDACRTGCGVWAIRESREGWRMGHPFEGWGDV